MPKQEFKSQTFGIPSLCSGLSIAPCFGNCYIHLALLQNLFITTDQDQLFVIPLKNNRMPVVDNE